MEDAREKNDEAERCKPKLFIKGITLPKGVEQEVNQGHCSRTSKHWVTAVNFIFLAACTVLDKALWEERCLCLHLALDSIFMSLT